MNKLCKILENNLGEKIKEYRNKWDRSGKNGYIPTYPLHLNFELKYGCNLKCDFCLYSVPQKEWRYNVETSKKISFDKYKEIIDEGSKNGLYSVEFNGINEPLLEKNIHQYIKYVHKKDILVSSLHTNAMLLTNDRSEELIDSGLKIIIFSVDAIESETYNRIRIGSDYDIILKNINNFLYIRKKQNSIFPLVQMSFCKNKLNSGQLSKYVDYWRSKVDFISTSNFCNPFIGTDKERCVEDTYRSDSYCLKKCYEPFQRLLIRNDGKVHFCCSFFGGENIVGNIYTNSIYDIWHGDKLNKDRLLVNDNKNMLEICKKCRLSMKSIK